MKANFLKRSLWLAAILLTSIAAKAQTSVASKTAYNSENRTTYYRTHNEGGKHTEGIKTEYDDKTYEIKWVNEKMTSLYVDGEKIAETDWSKYNDAIAHIREEIKKQIKRNEEQAKRNAEQAVRNEEQAKRNAEQAIHNEEQAKKNAEQVIRNEEQDKRNAEQAIRNEEQAKKNAEQEVKNNEQAMRNELQAKKNEEQAKANEQMIKDIINDLVADKIIPDTSSLHEMRLSEFGMSVNGVKQPEEIFKKYKEKYRKNSDGTFMYSRDGVIQGQ